MSFFNPAIVESTSKFGDDRSDTLPDSSPGSQTAERGSMKAGSYPVDGRARLLEDAMSMSSPGGFRLGRDNSDSRAAQPGSVRANDVDAGVAYQNCKIQEGEISRVLGLREAQRITKCDTSNETKSNAGADDNSLPFHSVQPPAPEQLYAKDLPKSRSGTYVGSLLRHGTDPYVKAGDFQERIERGQEKSRVDSAIGSAFSAGFSVLGANRLTDLSARASIDTNWSVIRREIQTWNANIGRFERIPESQIDLENKYRSLLVNPRTRAMGMIDKLPDVYRADALVRSNARAVKLNGLKTVGAGALGSVAVDQLLFKDSQQSPRTYLSDALSYVAVLLPGLNKLPTPLKVGAIVGLHTYNRHLDWLEQHP